MLVKAKGSDKEKIIKFLYQDPARHYFILLGLMKSDSTFDEIYLEISEHEIRSGIFKRSSGNLQLALSKKSDLKGIKQWIIDHSFNKLIGPKSFCEPFEEHLNLIKIGADIAGLHKNNYKATESSEEIKPLSVKDLKDVVKLYEKVFTGFPKESYMAEKLISQRGLGFKSHGMISVAQSDMGCLIVGVATEPTYQKMGYGRKVLNHLIQTLFKTHDEVYLQYEDEKARSLYLSMGFMKIDTIYHYEKRLK